MKLSKAEYQAVVNAAAVKVMPLDKLDLSKELQARHETPDPAGIEALAESILKSGMLHNMVVTPATRGRADVCAGGRRWLAHKWLASKNRIAQNHPVMVLEVPKEAGLMVSLAENIFRQPLSPADEFSAFAKLIEQGRSVEDVASAFSVTPLFVKRRMKLAQVSPVLLQEFRKGLIALDCLMVLASVDDHARQEQVWQQIPDWQRRPESLRRLLTQGEISAANDPVAAFVTASAYEQAGGTVRRDLFSNEDEVYLLDAVLLEKLAVEKLQPVLAQVQAEGWLWVDVCARFEPERYQSHGSLRPTPRAPYPQEQVLLDQLNQRLGSVREALDELEDEDTSEGARLVNEEDEVSHQIHAIHEALFVWRPECLPHAGCVVHVSRHGDAEIRRGLIRPQDRSAIQALLAQDEPASRNPVVALPAPHTKPVHPEKLVRSLTAHRVAALQAEVIQRPRVALAILTAHLWSEFHQSHGSLMLGFHATNVHENLRKEASDMAQSKAWEAVDKECEGWQKLVPMGRTEGVLPWLLEQDQSVVEGLLAAMVAVCIPGVSSSEKPDPTTQVLMKAVSLDMTSWWKPTAEGYLDHVSKTRIEAVVREAVHPQAALALRDLKKPDMVSAAVKVLEDTKWLPDCLRPIDHDRPAANDPQGEEDDVRVG